MTALYEPTWSGCDHFLPDGRYCERHNAPHVDEVDDLRYCAEHAGPLSWDGRTINLYSLAVRVAGHLDVPVVWHARNERAA